MVNINKIHLVPQIITDLVEKMFSEQRNYAQQNYQQRIETIRDYCNEELERLKIFKVTKNNNRNKN